MGWNVSLNQKNRETAHSKKGQDMMLSYILYNEKTRLIMMFQVVGNPAPLLTNVTDIVAESSASMHQKFKTFSRPPTLPATTPNPQQNIGKFSTLARVEKIQTATNSKEGLQAETDQGKSHLKDYIHHILQYLQNNVLFKYDVRPVCTMKPSKVGKFRIAFSSFLRLKESIDIKILKLQKISINILYFIAKKLS